MNEQEDVWLFTEDVAALLGVTPATVRHYAAQAKGRRRKGPWDFPAPGRYRRRATATGGTRSPQWLEAVIVEHRDAERPPRKRIPAGKPAGGQYAPKRRRVA